MMSFDEKIDRWGMNLEKTLRSSHNLLHCIRRRKIKFWSFFSQSFAISAITKICCFQKKNILLFLCRLFFRVSAWIWYEKNALFYYRNILIVQWWNSKKHNHSKIKEHCLCLKMNNKFFNKQCFTILKYSYQNHYYNII